MGRSADVPRSLAQFVGGDTGCTILHVDMDAFFASVEIRRRPDLRGKAVVVGGGVRGVVAAASYEARRYGIRSAMPVGQALRLCPTVVVLPPDRSAYSQASSHVMAILRAFTPLVEPLSLDEAFLDVSGSLRLHGRPTAIAEAIRARVAADLELTCSVGVAPRKFIAKLASARCKPDGMLVVPESAVLHFLHPLPVTVLPGVGERTGQSLRRLGIRTVAHLAETPLDTLRRAVGAALAAQLHELAHGRDDRAVEPHEGEKSISAEHTLDVDFTEEAQVCRELLSLAAEVGRRVRGRGLAARTIGLKVRFADFQTVTRVRTLPSWTDSSAAIYATATELYRGLGLDRPRIRLVGVKAENFRDAGEVPEQLTLEQSGTAPGYSGSERVIDAAQQRFGVGVVRHASLLSPPERAPVAGRRPAAQKSSSSPREAPPDDCAQELAVQ
ncbi:MAG: DNA polymerase IV [Actinomycetota bacterium]|nr:DNA polymerase IV [Actinomycetota bacterium]